MERISSPSRLLLGQMADALGISVEQFFTDNSRSNTVAETAEIADCLRLWSRIRTEEGRRRALETLRLIANAEAP